MMGTEVMHRSGMAGRFMVLAVTVALIATVCVTAPVFSGKASADGGSWYRQESSTSLYLAAVSASDNDKALAVGDMGIILRTDTGGEDWYYLNSPTNKELNCVAVSPGNRNVAWAVGNDGVIFRTDNRTTWTAQRSGVWTNIEAIWPLSDTHAWATGQAWGIPGAGFVTALYTNDGGKNWTQTGPQWHSLKTCFAVSGTDKDHVWIVGKDGYIYYTDNKGSSWTVQHDSGPTLRGVSAVDSKNVWAVGYNGTILKYDGRNWTAQNSGIGDNLEWVQALDSNNAWASGANGTVLYTNNGGKTWTVQSKVTDKTLFGLSASGNSVWAVGSSGTIINTPRPEIVDCYPQDAYQGETKSLLITGANTHFNNDSSALFSDGGIKVNYTEPLGDPNHVIANVTVDKNAKPGFRDVNVKTSDWQLPLWLNNGFQVKEEPPKPPHIDSLNPNHGKVSTPVLISGSNFGDSYVFSHVEFNGARVPGPSIINWSNSSITCEVPDAATSGPVVVHTPTGESNRDKVFTVEQPPKPRIIDTNPNSVKQGDSSVNVTITGDNTHFKQGNSRAVFDPPDGIIVNSTTVSGSQPDTVAVTNITVAYNAPRGARNVNVMTGGEVPEPMKDGLTVQAIGEPYLESINPTSGSVGDPVTLNGNTFGQARGTSYVSFNGKPATVYQKWTDGNIVCNVPAGATTGPLKVVTPWGTSGSELFTVGEPFIDDCGVRTNNPEDKRIVMQGQNVNLDIAGEYTHFAAGKSAASFSGTGIDVNKTNVSDKTHATANISVDDKAPPGSRNVNVITGGETPRPLWGGLRVVAAPESPPLIRDIDPASGPVGAVVSLTGINFGVARGSSSVTFGGTAAESYIAWSDNEVVCEVPSGAKSGAVKVRTAWGTSNGINFTVTDPKFYLAEGTCRPDYVPYLTIQNPTGKKAQIKITYMLGNGAAKTQGLMVPAHTRATVTVKSLLGEANNAAHDFSAVIESVNGVEIVVERPMYFNYNGNAQGGSDDVGIIQPLNTSFFAEGTCRPEYAPYICLQNPDSTDASCTLTYMRGAGPNKAQRLAVPAHSRATVSVKSVLGHGNNVAYDYSTKVEVNGTATIATESSLYKESGPYSGGDTTAGAQMIAPSQAYYFAEGSCRPGFEPFFAVMNTSGSNADVLVTYMLGNGKEKKQVLTVPAHSRSTINVRDVLGVGDDVAHDFSAKVECFNGVKIFASRSMYFSYHPQAGVSWDGSTMIRGDYQPTTSYLFAEGTCRTNFASFFSVQNPGLAHTRVKITCMTGDRKEKAQTIVVPAQSRSTVKVEDILGAGNDTAHDFSASVESLDGVPVVVERPMYFAYNPIPGVSWMGGTVSFGLGY